MFSLRRAAVKAPPYRDKMCDQLTPPLMVDCTPYHDWRVTISISLGWTQASISLSICPRRTRPKRHYGIGRTGTHHWRYSVSIVRGHTLCLLHLSWQHRLCSKVSLGQLVRRRDQYPAARSCLRMVRTDIRLPNRRIICIRRWGAEMKGFVLTILSSWGSSRGMLGQVAAMKYRFVHEPPRFLWCGQPVSRFSS